ncbi:MAG: hypothetical protein O3A46_07095 [Candidatus Poribacteria bacterium]|nr:hypothetical protein [Candidatus Poribacteria bacterium]
MELNAIARRLRRFQIRKDECLIDIASARPLLIADALVSVDPTSDSPYPSANKNQAQYLGVEREVSPETLDEIVEVYRRANVARFFLPISPSPQAADIPKWFRKRKIKRFQGTGYPTLLRKAETLPSHETELTVRRVSREEVAAHEDAVRAIYTGLMDAPGFLKPLGQPDFHSFLAFDGDTPVAGGVLWVDGDFGFLTNAITAESHRGRGAQSALIVARTNLAVELGCAWVASETLYLLRTSFGNLKRKGFEEVYAKQMYVWENPGG